jgi:F0F1-type ATP synthase assembly protein I
MQSMPDRDDREEENGSSEGGRGQDEPSPELTDEEIDLRRRELVEGVETPRPGIDPEFEERLTRVEGATGRARTRQAGREWERKERERRDRESTHGLGVGMSIAYTIIGLPLAGAFVGWLLDRYFGTQLLIGLGMMIGAVGGVAMAFVLLGRTQQK